VIKVTERRPWRRLVSCPLRRSPKRFTGRLSLRFYRMNWSTNSAPRPTFS
jgi:hypothetical protein